MGLCLRHAGRRSNRCGSGRRPGLSSHRARSRRTNAFRQDGSLPAWASGLEAMSYVISPVLQSRLHTDDEGCESPHPPCFGSASTVTATNPKVASVLASAPAYAPRLRAAACPSCDELAPTLRRGASTLGRQPRGSLALGFPLTSALPPAALRPTGFGAPASRPCSGGNLTATAFERPLRYVPAHLACCPGAEAPLRKARCPTSSPTHPHCAARLAPCRTPTMRGSDIRWGTRCLGRSRGAVYLIRGGYRLRPPRRIGMVRGLTSCSPETQSRQGTVRAGRSRCALDVV